MPESDDATLREFLDAETIAVVGCSTSPGKPAHDVPKYLQSHGYRIVPINPFADEILGETAYDALGDVPADVRIDLVDVFRPSDELPGVVDDVIERHEDHGDAGAVWFQLGLEHDAAAARAEEAGIRVVQDRCLKVEHGRLVA